MWDHVVCNECVYFAKPLDVNGESPHVLAEKYVRNDLWFHIRWAKREPRQARHSYNEALIESVLFNETLHSARELNGPIAAIDGNGPMFVEVPKFVESPEFMCMYGIRSVIRLKRIQSAVDTGVEQSAFLPVGLIGSTNREGNSGGGCFVGRNRARKQADQVPSELVERTAETVNEISDSERDFLIRWPLWCDYENVMRSLRIVFLGDSVRVAFNPISQLLLRSLEVKVSPSSFHVHIVN